MYDRHQTTHAAELENLGKYCDFIKSACEQHPEITDPIVYNLQLAVD